MLSHELLRFFGMCVFVMTLSEMHMRVTPAVGILLIIRALLWAYSRGIVIGAKVSLVAMASAIAFYRSELESRHVELSAIFRGLLFANVAIMMVPPLYNGQLFLALQVLWLACLTPRDAFDDDARAYWWAYTSVFTTYFLFAKPFEGVVPSALVSILPMVFALLVYSDSERVIIYRGVAILVAFQTSIFWTLENPLPPTLFRTPVARQSQWTDLPSALQQWTQRHDVRAVAYALDICALLRARTHR